MQRYLSNLELLIAIKLLLYPDEVIKLVIDTTRKEVLKNKEFYQDLFKNLKFNWEFDIHFIASYLVKQILDEDPNLYLRDEEFDKFMNKPEVTKFIKLPGNNEESKDYIEKRCLSYEKKYDMVKAIKRLYSNFYSYTGRLGWTP